MFFEGGKEGEGRDGGVGEEAAKGRDGKARRGCSGLACLGEPTPFVRLLSIKVSNFPPNCKVNIGSSSPLILMTVFSPRTSRPTHALHPERKKEKTSKSFFPPPSSSVPFHFVSRRNHDPFSIPPMRTRIWHQWTMLLVNG